MYLANAFIQSKARQKRQGQPIPRAISVKGLALGPNGETSLLTMEFEPATFQMWTPSADQQSHAARIINLQFNNDY